MAIDEALIERLLYEGEGPSLDYKRDQYPFAGASDEKKAELLKDILAFANASRRSDAFILIGVEEIQGGPANPVGVSAHLADNDLQQFVNSKTQRPVKFLYKPVPFKGVMIDVIHIPLQPRPFFLKLDYGRLKRNIVYVRRGSSTAEADPDETANMGREDAFLAEHHPDLQLRFADGFDGQELGDRIALEVTKLTFPPLSVIPKVKLPQFDSMALYQRNEHYYEELARYLGMRNSLKPVHFRVSNVGDAVAQGVRVEIRILNSLNTYYVAEDREIPYEAEREHMPIRLSTFPRNEPPRKPDAFIRQSPDSPWMIEVDIGKVQAKAYVVTKDPIWIGPHTAIWTDVSIQASALLFADNIAEPVESDLWLDFRTTERHMSLEDFLLYGIKDGKRD